MCIIFKTICYNVFENLEKGKGYKNMEDKLYYLAKTLSRTERKDKENYVVNRIYHKLDDLEIKPMTQKYVKKHENGYYLIDLYFPQFNIGVECDEGHHKKKKSTDKLRTEDIIGELRNYREERVKVYDTDITDVNTRIDEIITLLKTSKQEQIKNGSFKRWEIQTPQEYFENKEKISIFDDIEFSTIKEACNLIFGTNYKGQRKSWFPIKTIKNKNITAWFPQLAIEKYNTFIASSNGWVNTINDNKDTIFEYKDFGKNTNNEFDKKERITFMKMKDKNTNKSSYKFLGVFLPINKENGKVTYKRIDTEFKIIKN